MMKVNPKEWMAAMSRELICQWLKLPADPWPPDHYSLLGVPPAEKDIARIEQTVEQRMQAVRRYQLTNPEAATEALNLLARAFICLTDPNARKAYDAALFGTAEPVAEEAEEAPEELLDAPEAAPEPVRAAVASPPQPPPPVRRPPAPPRVRGKPSPSSRATPFPKGGLNPPAVPLLPAEPVAPPPPAAPNPVAIPLEPAATSRSGTNLPAVPPRETPDPGAEAAKTSPAARRGLGTKRALYHRLVRTRKLARAWEQASRFLAWPKRRVSRTDAPELAQALADVRTEVRGFPLMGEAGQPGYLVVALSRQADVLPTFQALLSSQREALARDWWAGRTLLTEHREFLRRELRVLRKKSPLGRAVHAVWAAVTDQPGRLLLLLALVAINVALWRTFCAPDPNTYQSIKPPAPGHRR